MSVSADQGQPAQNLDPLSQFFRTDFTGPSIGTEQELTGVRIFRHRDASRRIAEVLKNGKELVIVTTDMVHAKLADDYLECTLELVTTPTEATDKDGWVSRIAAMEMVVGEIELAARRTATGGALLAKKLDNEYELRIFNPHHRIANATPYGTATVTGSDRQGTVGVPADQLLQPFQPSNSRLPLAQGLPAPQWYPDGAVHHAPANLSTQGAQAYALIKSAIWEFLNILSNNAPAGAAIMLAGRLVQVAARAQLLADQAKRQSSPMQADTAALAESNQKLALEALLAARKSMAELIITPDWKNSWRPLPRTPVVNLLELLSAAEAKRVREALQALTIPGLNEHVLAAAKKHILDGESLGGHRLPVPTINHRKGFLVEYRSGVPEFFNDHFLYIATERKG
jgi:hypothetical protein